MTEQHTPYASWLKARDLLRELRQSGARLGLKAGQLSLSAPKGAITASQREDLTALKAQILTLLQLEQKQGLSSQPDLHSGPLTSAQARMWFLQKLHPESDLLNLSGACQITGHLDLKRLQAALMKLSERQSSLRTVFPEEGGKPLQHILPSLELRLEIMAEDSESQTKQAITTWCAQPFDLRRGPLMRMGWWPQGNLRGILAWSLHHLIADGWSTGVLFQELLAAYHGLELPMPQLTCLDLTVQENQPAPWQDQALAFYRQALGGFPSGLDLPGETCPAVPGPAEIEMPLPMPIWDAVEEFGKTQGYTPFQIALSAWAVLLRHYGLPKQFIMGTPVSGRWDTRLENLIGCLINTLMLPIDMSQNLSFAELCGQQSQHFQVHLLWQSLPFEKVVTALPKTEVPQPEIYFVFQNTPLQIPPLEIQATWLDLPQQPPPFPLTLTLEPGRYKVRLSSNLKQLGPELLKQMLEDYLQLLPRLLAQAELPWSQVPLLPPEREKTALQTGKPEAEVPPIGWIHQFVEGQAKEHPNAVALLWQEQTLSYGELNQAANRLARQLQAQGLKPHMRVAIWLEVGPTAIVSLLAVLKSGALYVPIDQEQPLIRAAKILSFARPHFLLTETERPITWPTETDTAQFDRLDPHLLLKEAVGLRSDDLDLPIQAHDLAYMIFTSGSTGEPNGVEISHEQVARLFPAVGREVELKADDTWVLFHSLAFDYSVWEIWGAFYAGARLLLISRSLARDGFQFWHTLVESTVTTLNLTPSALRSLQPVLQQAKALPPLRWLILSGEKLELGMLETWFSRFDEAMAVYNSYGITETTVFVSFERITPAMVKDSQHQSPLGQPLEDLGLTLLDSAMRPVPDGVVGEITVTGAGLAQGYFENPSLTKARFQYHPHLGRIYVSGDFARRDRDGRIHYLSRRDTQLKIRGFRLETAEIETTLRQIPGIADARVALQTLKPGQNALIAYMLPDASQRHSSGLKPEPSGLEVRRKLQEALPPAWIPDHFIWVDHWPLTLNGKVNVKALPLPEMHPVPLKLNAVEQQLQTLLAELNGGIPLDPDQNLMDQGFHSLKLVEAQAKIAAELGQTLALMDFFAAPTLRQLAQKLQSAPNPQGQPQDEETRAVLAVDAPIAVIAMAGRFPGANSVEALWEMLLQGETGLTQLSEDRLRQQGVPEAQLKHPHYVPVTGILPDMAAFDRELFQMTGSEAQLLDPQQRLMLETAWQALEQAGYGQAPGPRPFGVFAGAGISRYLLMNLLQAHPQTTEIHPMQALIANDKDYLATRVAYHLNLTGPALTVQTACSTSLVAIHLACESLRRGECEMALAGGVSLDPAPEGYLHQPGGIYSADGRCRPFEAEASGIVGGSGVGVVVLKPLAQAMADGDPILGQILSSAINNDGRQKLGFTAPGIAGQVEVLKTALNRAGVKPEQIRYVEAHGTGTALGDAVEIQALTQAWKSASPQLGNAFAAIGSLKANLGHLDAAAGITGLIKALLVLRHKQIPAQPQFGQPNPQIPWKESPVYPAQKTENLSACKGPLLGAVSSFGIGGTNAHAIVAGPPEAAIAAEPVPHPEPELILLSARSAAGLAQLQHEFLNWLSQPTSPPGLANLAHTLAVGRQTYPWRWALAAESSEDLATQLTRESQKSHSQVKQSQEIPGKASPPVAPPLLWLLPGLGSQCRGLAQDLQHIPTFIHTLNMGLNILENTAGQSALSQTLRRALFERGDSELRGLNISDPHLMQPLIFLLSFALGQTYLELGCRPTCLLGHSFGEFAALGLGGYLPLAELLRLVCLRGELFAEITGFTWAIQASARQVLPLLPGDVRVAAQNAAGQVTVAGSLAFAPVLRTGLESAGLKWIELPIPHAVHHPLLTPILDRLSQYCADQPWQQGTFPVYSAQLGRILTPADLGLADYWRAQTLEPVPFEACLQTLFAQAPYQTLEVGPGRGLSALSRSPNRPSPLWGLGADPHRSKKTFLNSLAQLWQRGVHLNFQALYSSSEQKQRSFRRLTLPSTPFEHQNYWISPPSPQDPNKPFSNSLPQSLLQHPWPDWFYGLEWQRRPLPALYPENAPPAAATHPDPQSSEVKNPEPPLLWLKWSSAEPPTAVSPPSADRPATLEGVVLDCRAAQNQDAEAVLHWALGIWGSLQSIPPMPFCFLMPPVQVVTGSERFLAPDLALLQGLSRVMPTEKQGLQCLWLESDSSIPITKTLIQGLWNTQKPELALRHHWLWEPNLVPSPSAAPPLSLPQGCYLISGSSGEIGRALTLALPAGSELVLLGRNRPHDLNNAFPQAAEITWITGDIADRESWKKALNAVKASRSDFAGVIHAAGSPDHHWLSETRWLTTQRENYLQWPVFAKWLGAKHLMDELQELALSPKLILLCSALSSLHGLPGQWAYTATNAALNALAGAYWQAGLPVKSICWGAWKEGGMAPKALKTHPVRRQALQAKILELGIEREQGQACLAWIYNLQHPTLAVSPLSPQALLKLSETGRIAGSESAQPEAVSLRAPRSVTHLPQGPLETSLAQIWAEALGLEGVGRDETWEALGGDSLLALQVRERLTLQLQRDISPAWLFQGSTIQSLAETLQNEHAPALLVPLQSQGSDWPLFCVHAISGTVFPFQTLARELGQPFFALQAKGLLGQTPHYSLEAMAAAYLESVEQTQPEGPLYLSGWSFGALVAFEMARQALARGRHVKHLVLLDLPLPPPGQVLAEEWVRQRFDLEMEKIGMMGDQRQTRELLYRVFEANLQAARTFQPTPLNLEATLVMADSGLAVADPRPGKGWADYLHSISLITVPGDHYTMLEGPGARVLAQFLNNLQSPSERN